MNVREECITVVDISASIPLEVLHASVKRVILETEFIAQVGICWNEINFLAIILNAASLPKSYFCLSYAESTQKKRVSFKSHVVRILLA